MIRKFLLTSLLALGLVCAASAQDLRSNPPQVNVNRMRRPPGGQWPNALRIHSGTALRSVCLPILPHPFAGTP